MTLSISSQTIRETSQRSSREDEVEATRSEGAQDAFAAMLTTRDDVTFEATSRREDATEAKDQDERRNEDGDGAHVIGLVQQRAASKAESATQRLDRARGRDDQKSVAVAKASRDVDALANALLVERSRVDGDAQDFTATPEDSGAANGKAKVAVQGSVDDGAIAAHAKRETPTEGQVTVPVPASETPSGAEPAPIRVPMGAEAVRAPIVPVQATPLTPQVVLPRAMAAVQQAMVQEGVNLKLLNDGARLTLQMQDGTELAVRLLMRDGMVEVRAAGLASTLLEGKGEALRTALSHEGLKLGSFQTRTGTGEGDAHEHAAFDDGQKPERSTGVGPSTPPKVQSTARRLHSGRSIVA